jgi:exopolysaccharide biosynthesis polyprenyl glycosylphosphotransferase
MFQLVRTNAPQKLLDVAANVFSFLLTLVLMNWLGLRFIVDIHLEVLLCLTILGVFIVGSNHPLYASNKIRTLKEELKQITSVVYRAFLTIFFILFITAEHSTVFKFFFGVYFFLAIVIHSVFRLLARLWLSWRREHGHNIRRTLIIGTGREALAVTKEIHTNNKEWAVMIAGYLAVLPQHIQHSVVPKTKLLGTVKDVAQILRAEIIDDVLIAINRTYENQVQEAIKICEAMGVNIKVKELMSILQKPNTKIEIDYIGNMQCLSFQTYPVRSWGLYFKRCVDSMAALVGLLILIPCVFLPVALLIKLTSRGPVFFLQERVGMRNRLFKIIKFRTMVVNAEQLKQQLAAKNENKDGITFKIKRDPRLTRIGGFLRKTSIDELPQLINVLLGQMSLVGPRPPLQTEVKKYTDNYLKRLAVRPGITGLWQISGRSDVAEFDKWVALDVRYIDTWSFGSDLGILLRTIPVVLLRKGAY